MTPAITQSDIDLYKEMFGFTDATVDVEGDDAHGLSIIARARIAGWNAAVEAAAEVAKWSAMVPPAGGCPTDEEAAVADEAALRIRNLRIDQEGKDDE